jgi:hypothetical protein
LAVAAGALGGAVGIPTLAAALFRGLPLAFVLLAIALIWMQRLGATARPTDRPRVRVAWKASAWLLLAAGVALPLMSLAGLAPALALVAVRALVAVLVNAIGDRVVPA